MAGTPSPSSPIQTVLLSLAPAAVLLGLGFLLARGQGMGLDDPTLAAANAANLFGLLGLLGLVMSGGILWFQLQSQPAAAEPASFENLARALERRDFEAAASEARQVPGMTAGALVALSSLAQPGPSASSASEAGVSAAMGDLRGQVDGVGIAMRHHLESVSQLDRALKEGLNAQDAIGDNVDGLSRSAEATSSSILQMVAINNEVTENIHNLSVSVQETTTAIEEMTFSVKEVAKNIEELSTAAEETAASMNEMDVSISQVETNANETSKLSETVTTDAETGVNAINKTIHGIDKIKESSRVAAEVIGSLGAKIDEIGNILTVIDDVAEQTNLLALNAAIIAAQAGEHGRGFAVVADEIKALAERTGSSTKEIADLIKTVQDESRNAITVMSQGVSDVDEGVRLGHNAEDALRKIVESAKRSTLMIKAIAQATVEQAKGSKQVTNAISRIAETVQQIALATAEQAKGAEQIMKSAERMKVITAQVERSTEEQNRGGRQMTESIENIREMVENIHEAQRQHQESQSRIESASELAESAGQKSIAALQELQTLIEKQLASS